MALPHYAYGDPAKIVEADQLHRLGCGGCERAIAFGGQFICSNDLRYPACRRNDRRGYKLSKSAGG